jgi:maltodextrin utilization protein YvdJ
MAGDKKEALGLAAECLVPAILAAALGAVLAGVIILLVFALTGTPL